MGQVFNRTKHKDHIIWWDVSILLWGMYLIPFVDLYCQQSWRSFAFERTLSLQMAPFVILQMLMYYGKCISSSAVRFIIWKGSHWSQILWDLLQILPLILSDFTRFNSLSPPKKSSENLRFSDDFRGNRI